MQLQSERYPAHIDVDDKSCPNIFRLENRMIKKKKNEDEIAHSNAMTIHWTYALKIECTVAFTFTIACNPFWLCSGYALGHCLSSATSTTTKTGIQKGCPIHRAKRIFPACTNITNIQHERFWNASNQYIIQGVFVILLGRTTSLITPPLRVRGMYVCLSISVWRIMDVCVWLSVWKCPFAGTHWITISHGGRVHESWWWTRCTTHHTDDSWMDWKSMQCRTRPPGCMHVHMSDAMEGAIRRIGCEWPWFVAAEF